MKSKFIFAIAVSLDNCINICVCIYACIFIYKYKNHEHTCIEKNPQLSYFIKWVGFLKEKSSFIKVDFISLEQNQCF